MFLGQLVARVFEFLVFLQFHVFFLSLGFFLAHDVVQIFLHLFFLSEHFVSVVVFVHLHFSLDVFVLLIAHVSDVFSLSLFVFQLSLNIVEEEFSLFVVDVSQLGIFMFQGVLHFSFEFQVLVELVVLEVLFLLVVFGNLVQKSVFVVVFFGSGMGISHFVINQHIFVHSGEILVCFSFLHFLHFIRSNLVLQILDEILFSLLILFQSLQNITVVGHELKQLFIFSPLHIEFPLFFPFMVISLVLNCLLINSLLLQQLVLFHFQIPLQSFLDFLGEFLVLHFLFVQQIDLLLEHILVHAVVADEIVWIGDIGVGDFEILGDLGALGLLGRGIARVSFDSVGTSLGLVDGPILRGRPLRVSNWLSSGTRLLRDSAIERNVLIFEDNIGGVGGVVFDLRHIIRRII